MEYDASALPDSENARPDDQLDFEEISELFLKEYRQGKNPSAEEYAERFPVFREEILELLPAITLLEKGGSSESLANFSECVGRKGIEPTDLKRLRNFKILREIGRGGMGVVYEAWDENLERIVALKVMKIFPGEEEQTLRRFQREAKMAAKLHHTNIVPVFGYDTVDDHFFYAMQLIDGVSIEQFLKLRERDATNSITRGRKRGKDSSNSDDSRASSEVLSSESLDDADDGDHDSDFDAPSGGWRRDPLDDENALYRALKTSDNTLLSANIASANYYQRVADLGIQAARALDYASRHDVVHRDIKPSNLIVDHEGVLWITDFGLAKPVGDSNLTRRGQLVGTLRYLAPEALEGNFSPLTDVYSLGLTLYEMLTFTPAFDEKGSTKLFAQVAHASPLRPRKLNPRIPRDLETIVLKAIERAPEKRYSAAEMADDLQRFLDERPIRARRVGLLERAWRWCKRNKLDASLAGMIACLLLTIFVVMFCNNLRMKGLVREKEEESQRAKANVSLALAAFDKLFETLVSQSHDDPIDFLDESASYSLSSQVDGVSERDAIALDEMLEFYVAYVNANHKDENDPALTYRTARAFFRTGVLRRTLGSGDAFDALRQAFAFYEKSLNATNSDVKREDVAREMGQLMLALYGAATSNADPNRLNELCEKTLAVINEERARQSSETFDLLATKIHFARAAFDVTQLRRLGGAELPGLFFAPEIPKPTEDDGARVEEDFDVVAQWVERNERAKNADDFDSVRLAARYYYLRALWFSMLRDQRSALDFVQKGLERAERLCELRPDDPLAYVAKLSADFVKARVLFETFRAPNSRESEFDPEQELDATFTETLNVGAELLEKNPDSPVNALAEINIRLYFAQMAASCNDKTRVETFLKEADEQMAKFVVEFPHYGAVSSVKNKLNIYCAQFLAREKRFDEARKRLDAVKEEIRAIQAAQEKTPNERNETRVKRLKNVVDQIEKEMKE